MRLNSYWIRTDTRSERAYSISARPIAIDVFNEHVGPRTPDCNALVLVWNFDVMNVDVIAPDIDAIQTAFVSSSDDHAVDFSVTTGVEDKVERRSFR